MENLYNEYKAERGISINEDLFYNLVFLYPPILVAKADGVFDDKEKEYLANISATLAVDIFENEAKAEKNAELIFNELIYLSSDGENKWNTKFLTILKNNLSEKEDKVRMYEMLKETAEVSNGISIQESELIKKLKIQLDL